MTNAKQDNDMTDRKGVVYTKNETKLLWSIELNVIFDENQIEQRRDWSYRSGLRWKQSRLIVID